MTIIPHTDGTCLRDYVHVTDLADAHLLAVDRIEQGASSISVAAQAIPSCRPSIMQRVAGRKVPYCIRPPARRSGGIGRVIRASSR